MPESASGAIGGCIVVAGGGTVGDQAEATPSVESFDPARGTWEETTPMPLPTRGSAFGVLDGKLFVAGGWSADGVTQALQAFDPSTKVWEHKAPMPFRLWGAASCVHEGVLYVIGGRLVDEDGELAITDILLLYDAATDRWEEEEPMPTPRANVLNDYAHKATVHHRRIVVIGGGPCAPAFLYDLDGTWKLFMTTVARVGGRLVSRRPPSANVVALSMPFI